jgi:hypothetical protein
MYITLWLDLSNGKISTAKPPVENKNIHTLTFSTTIDSSFIVSQLSAVANANSNDVIELRFSIPQY